VGVRAGDEGLNLGGSADAFVRYLAAKKPLDDRSLNAHAWAEFVRRLTPAPQGRPRRLLEVGAGIGTMIERLLERSRLGQAHYVALEPAPALAAVAAERLEAWAREHGWGWHTLPQGFRLEGEATRLEVEWLAASAYDELSIAPCDVVLGHAVLDLLDLDRALPRLLGLVGPGGLFYFSLNFDGLTAFLPEIDPDLDRQVVDAYHASMDSRREPTAGSRCGRRLLEALPRLGASPLAAGASDWVIHPIDGAYLGDEAFLLHYLLDMLTASVGGMRLVDAKALAQWVEKRRRQVEAAGLTFLAHQIDVLGQAPG
jgi:SAM-dependent methyltransferase